MITAGKLAVTWSLWGSGIVLAVYVVVWFAIQGYGDLALGGFLAWTALSGLVVSRRFLNVLGKAKTLRPGTGNDWILVLTILAVVFTIGAAMQTVSTINSQTVSLSSCVSPPRVNVTSPNCVQVQTVTHTEGPFLYYSQLGLLTVGFGIFGALVFGVSYLVLVKLPSILADD